MILAMLVSASGMVAAEPVSHADAVARIMPDAGKILHGVFPGGYSGDEDDITLEQVADYEKTVGRRVDWVMFSNNWFSDRNFPTSTADWIRKTGAVPYVRLMLRSDTEEDHSEKLFSLKAIVRGDFDADLKKWGRQVARFASPVIAEFGTEMNGRWFPWNAHWNGRKRGAAMFAKTYRHIIDMTRRAGASNIVWVFHVNNEDDPVRSWNRFERYYPGDDYIDWLGVSIYSAQSPFDKWLTDFTKSLPQVMRRFAKMAPSKPVIIAEMGTDVRNRRQNAAKWADAAISMILSGRWSKLIGFNWWNETWPNGDDPARATDMRVQSDAALVKIMRKHLASPKLQKR